MSFLNGVVVECGCDDWRLHSGDIFRAQIAYSQDHGAVWRGGVFKFCPWCGKPLESISHDKVIVKQSGNTAFTKFTAEQFDAIHDYVFSEILESTEKTVRNERRPNA